VLGTPPRHDFRIHEQIDCTPAQLFAVVSDVERYAEFLPFCTSSRVIRRRNCTSFDAKLSLGFLGFSEAYTSKVSLRPPYSVEARAADTSLFSHLRTEWLLSDGQRRGTCALEFRLEMQLRSSLHDHALRRVLDKIAAQQVAAFKQRCVQLYGPSSEQSTDGVAANDPEGRCAAVEEPPRGPGESAATAAEEGGAETREGEKAAGGQLEQAAEGAATVLQIDPSWRQRVEATFDAFQVEGALSLRGFVEACRSLSISTGVLTPELQTSIKSATSADDSRRAEGKAAAMDTRHPASELDSIEARRVLLAGMYLEFDQDASGRVERGEFRDNLWVMTRATEEERANYSFLKLDMNRSGKLEKDDLARSMRRQLELARVLIPIMVHQQLREVPGSASPSPHEAVLVSKEAMLRATSVIDELEAQIDYTVDDVFAQIDLDSDGAITQSEWRDAWDQNHHIARSVGLDCVLASMSSLSGRPE